MKRPTIIGAVVSAVVLAAAIGVVVAARRARLTTTTDSIPVAQVTRGDLDMTVHATGELRASHVSMLLAPTVGGGSLQITQLLTKGSIKKGDIVIEFDPSEQRYKLDQNRSELLQAEQEITKANADALVLAAQDKVATLKDSYAVRRSELDVQKGEIVSAIDAKKNQLALEQAKRVQAQQVKDGQSHISLGKASIYLANEKRNKARLAMDQAQQNIDKMHVPSTMDGLVSIQRNYGAVDFYSPGMSLPEFHAGDQVRAGSTIAQVVDPMGLELSSTLSERNHSNIKMGQAVEVQFDAFRGRTFHGTVKTVAGMAGANIFNDSTQSSFSVTIQLADADTSLRSGYTAQVLFLGDKQKNVLYVPRLALFVKDGKRIVYVKRGNEYDQREIKIKAQSESKAAIDGLDAGTLVALIDPTVPRKIDAASAASPSVGGKP